MNKKDEDKKRFYVIDGNAYIHRAFHALPPLMTSSHQQVNAVFGFIKLLLKIKKKFNPDYLAVCFDYPAKNFRHEISPDYKATRKELDESLISQMPIARHAVGALNIKEVEMQGFEADDLIASIAKNNESRNIQTIIVTGDKDILQIVKDGEVVVYNESKDIFFDEKEVEQKYGVKPDKLLDVFSLMGDVSDNVKGIKGIGPKTAVKLINEFGSLEGVLKNAAQIKGNVGEILEANKEDALMSRKLISLKDDVFDKGKYDPEVFKVKEIDVQKALDFFKKYEFKSLIKELLKDSDAELPLEKTDVPAAHDLSFSAHIIDGMAQLLELVKKIEEEGVFTICTFADNLQIAGVSICIKENAYYIALSHNDLSNQQILQDDFLNVFGDILKDKNIKKVGYDLKKERNIYLAKNIKMEGIFFDVMLAQYCLNPASSCALDVLARKYLGLDLEDPRFKLKRSQDRSFCQTLIVDAAKFANDSSFIISKLWEILDADMARQKAQDLFFKIEMPILEVLSDIENAGIAIDESFLRTFDRELVENIAIAQEKIFEIAGVSFNINSPKQLGQIMFEKLNFPTLKKTKTGYATDEEVLTQLKDYPFCEEVLKYREFQKLKNTYVDPILIASKDTGRIKTNFNQTGTATGRLSSSDPNLQNIPTRSDYGKKLRKAFIAPSGNILISADYSQIDLRVLADISGDKKMVEAFKEGQDIHAATAREVFNIAPDLPLDPRLRTAAKAINFGIIYGISPFGLSKQLNISVGQAKEYIDGYLEKYKGVKRWMDQSLIEAKKVGFVETLAGRKRYIPELLSANKAVAAGAWRIALNTPIQGTSADIIKIAMINISQIFHKKKYKTKMILQVHDDLLFETPQDEINEIISIVKEKMENAVCLKVPLIVDMKSGKNWGEMAKL
ncbi:MAG: DNA polymerase I [Elusimicrobiota bacterium]|nr:DNA polymerase I [Elusimicrobiota bacterium]